MSAVKTQRGSGSLDEENGEGFRRQHLSWVPLKAKEEFTRLGGSSSKCVKTFQAVSSSIHSGMSLKPQSKFENRSSSGD